MCANLQLSTTELVRYRFGNQTVMSLREKIEKITGMRFGGFITEERINSYWKNRIDKSRTTTVQIDGFWERGKKGKKEFFKRPGRIGLVAVRDPYLGGTTIRIMTTVADKEVKKVHKRMPKYV